MTNTTTETTTEVIARMLKQNTGRVLVDSGDYYGRHFEQNQDRDFEKEPEAVLHVERPRHEGERLECWPVFSVYHWLKDRLEYNADLDERYRYYCGRMAYNFSLHSAERFVEDREGKGIYGDGGPVTVNTHNGEDLLSQTVQFVYWTDGEGDAHVLLQIHNGCDVRWGYTDPVAFDVGDYDGTAIFDNARGSVSCAECCRHWDTDDGVHFAPDGACGEDYTPLGEYPTTLEKPEYPRKPDPAQLTLPIDLPEKPTPDIGVIWIDEEGKAHCPSCGGVLEAWFQRVS